ncbi:tyrosine-type recombinase/integrase [Methanosphaera cuniculi]|uniref:Uncharacterized protein n=1 Tax=Methanosphaera cuniculi TaxID=1077256 RepID=A0A2A2HDS5_9EURY|nr:tyrosine-type recombinase/integrase [Methanosphaera cuniculi]PAV07470.1 hypothetical protein ASJ82_02755 [Methanosphaera cuniculi]
MTLYINDLDRPSQNIVKQWFTIRSIAPSTQKVYICYMDQFVKYSNTTIYKLYNKSLKEQQEQKPLEKRTLTKKILDYKYEMDNSNYAQTTKRLKMKVIISFCRAFRLETPEIRQPKAVCEPKNYERRITKDEIKKMLNTSPLRERAFLSIQALTGMSSKEVRTLKVSDIITCINNELSTNYTTLKEVLSNKKEILNGHIYKIHLIRRKVNYRYITFIPPETMNNIIEYLQYRTQQTNKTRISLYDDDLIFRTIDGNSMNSRTVTGMYREMGKKVGFQNEPNTYRFWRSHNIRKYFYNIVEETVGQVYADEWLGHIPSQVTQAYARRENRMKQAYKRCLPILTLESEAELSDVEEQLKILEDEIRKLMKTL